jgi:hypothetical protein
VAACEAHHACAKVSLDRDKYEAKIQDDKARGATDALARQQE